MYDTYGNSSHSCLGIIIFGSLKKIMKKSLLFVSVVLLITCSQINKKMIVNGTIKGLQKGTIYLQHVEDTKYVTLDSLIIKFF